MYVLYYYFIEISRFEIAFSKSNLLRNIFFYGLLTMDIIILFFFLSVCLVFLKYRVSPQKLYNFT